MAPFEAPTRGRQQSAMMSATVARPSDKPRRRPHRSTNRYIYDDDDDLELPVVHTKPLSVADSIAKFHRVQITDVAAEADVHTLRQQATRERCEDSLPVRKRSSSTSSTASSVSTVSTLSSASSYASSISSTSSSGSTSSRKTSKSRAHQRPKYHGTAKQALRQNRLSYLVLHSVTPREASSLDASKSSSSHYIEYEVVVENVRTSQVWQVARRFSSFVQFRKELAALFEVPHCHHCTSMHSKLDVLHDDFPAKRLWGSNSKKVTTQRATKLQVYLDGLLTLAATSHTKHCRLIASSFAMHLRGFLTVESTRFHGIPGGENGSVPSLLQELSRGTSSSVAAAPLATIEETSPSHSTRSQPWESETFAILETVDDDETESEEDESPGPLGRPIEV